jgi:large subunit ribosomal protein L25
MAEVKLEAEKRDETGKGPARRARAGGKVPATIYGKGLEPRSIAVDRRDLLAAFRTDAGMNVLLEIAVDGDKTLALTKELQRDPVKGVLLHVDFVKVDRTQEVEVEVPVHIVGESPGVKEGGVLESPLFTLHVRCLVTNVPEHVEADISRLAIGDALRVSDLPTDKGFTILNDPDSVVASVAAPISVEELEAMEAAAGVETEVPEEVPEGEEVPEEAAAEAEGAVAEETPAPEEAPEGE